MTTDPPVDIVDRYPKPNDGALTAADRCDQCGAQAYVRVTLKVTDRLPNGGTLLYCLHHYDRNAESITPIATRARIDIPAWWPK